MQPKALTIAGSDSGGGAGIQADLKTFAALDVYGSSVLTAITAQNTVAVTGVQEISTDLIAKQFDAVMEDIGAAAAKTGMLSSASIIETVAQKISEHKIEKYVLDPVMVAKSGDKLLADSAIGSLINNLLPLAFVITPNLPEAQVLTGLKIANIHDARHAAEKIHGMGPRFVVIKGGHFQSERSTDIVYDGSGFSELDEKRIQTKNTHGTGCTFSAAITASLAHGRPAQKAIAEAKDYITGAIQNAYTVGKGHSPVHHFFEHFQKQT